MTMTVADYHDHGDVESSKTRTLTDSDYEDCANFLAVDVRSIKTIAAVESGGAGFTPNDDPKILFEAHQFYKYTDGLFAESHPDLCVKRWDRTLYGKTWRLERIRFNRAEALDEEAALMATSWGKFQIMGFNFKACGFSTVYDFVKAMHVNEGAQLAAFSRFIKAHPNIHQALQDGDWYGVSLYNGTGNRDDWTAKARKAWDTFA